MRGELLGKDFVCTPWPGVTIMPNFRSWNERYIFSLDMDRYRWIVPILYVSEINIINSFIQ